MALFSFFLSFPHPTTGLVYAYSLVRIYERDGGRRTLLTLTRAADDGGGVVDARTADCLIPIPTLPCLLVLLLFPSSDFKCLGGVGFTCLFGFLSKVPRPGGNGMSRVYLNVGNTHQWP